MIGLKARGVSLIDHHVSCEVNDFSGARGPIQGQSHTRRDAFEVPGCVIRVLSTDVPHAFTTNSHVLLNLIAVTTIPL